MKERQFEDKNYESVSESKIIIKINYRDYFG